jgi:hypothetical protein
MTENADTSRWFVDAWAVRDGRLFASRRPPESIDAKSTVFLSVPDLEPIPVGRISTALRATRAGFQEGFRDDEGAEGPFESLEDVRELARRGYLGGEIGGSTPGVPIAIAPGPTPGAGGAYLDQVIEELGLDRVDTEAGWLLDQMSDFEVEQVKAAVASFAEASILEWGDVLLRDHRLMKPFGAWLVAVQSSGVLDQSATLHPQARWSTAFAEFVSAEGAPLLAEVAARLGNVVEGSARKVGYSIHRLISIAPLPRSQRWDVRLTRVGEIAVLPLISARFRHAHWRPIDIAPAVFSSAMAAAIDHLGAPGDGSAVRLAISRCSRDLSEKALPAAAELAIEAYIESLLDGAPPYGPHTPSTPVERSDTTTIDPVDPTVEEAPTVEAHRASDVHEQQPKIEWVESKTEAAAPKTRLQIRLH